MCFGEALNLYGIKRVCLSGFICKQGMVLLRHSAHFCPSVKICFPIQNIYANKKILKHDMKFKHFDVHTMKNLRVFLFVCLFVVKAVVTVMEIQ